MTPDGITHLFKEAYDTFPPLEGKPTDDDLLAIQECILSLLMVIPFDQLNGIHSLTVILTEAAKYKSEHGNATFVRPARLPLYDKIAKFLHNVVDEIWYNDLKDAETFYTEFTAIEIMALLDTNSGGLHAVDMISLRTNMTQYYVQADGSPQFIIMIEDTQKRAKRVGMPIG